MLAGAEGLQKFGSPLSSRARGGPVHPLRTTSPERDLRPEQEISVTLAPFASSRSGCYREHFSVVDVGGGGGSAERMTLFVETGVRLPQPMRMIDPNGPGRTIWRRGIFEKVSSSLQTSPLTGTSLERPWR